jgi:hypothetical protein
MARIGLGKILAGVAGVAAAGAAWMYFREKSIETPDHETIECDGAFEIRRYPALIVAETRQHGARDRALGNGFGLLADYIFAESREGEEIAMTAPVFAVPVAKDWTIRFVMPRSIDRDDLPKPGRGVTIAEVPSRTVAVLRFGGRADDKLLASREAELRAWLEERGIAAVGAIEHAFYDSPIMPGPLRQNEVMVEIEPPATSAG